MHGCIHVLRVCCMCACSSCVHVCMNVCMHVLHVYYVYVNSMNECVYASVSIEYKIWHHKVTLNFIGIEMCMLVCMHVRMNLKFDVMYWHQIATTSKIEPNFFSFPFFIFCHFFLECRRVKICSWNIKNWKLLKKNQKSTTPGVPRRSPIQVLSWPDDA